MAIFVRTASISIDNPSVPRRVFAGTPSILRVLIWLMVSLGLIELFYFVDWDRGIYRFLILMALVGVGTFGMKLFERIPFEIRPSRRLAWVGVALFVALFGLNLYESISSIRTAYEKGEPASDQAQTAIRAISLLGRGIDPYGRKTFLDAPAQDSIHVAAFKKRFIHGLCNGCCVFVQS